MRITEIYSFKKTYLIVFILLISNLLKAEIKLPAIFNDGMVLQQNIKTTFWGKANSNRDIEITPSWSVEKYVTKSDVNGNWKVKIDTPKAGGPFSISIKDNDTNLILKNVLIGEVWVCSGQSNMEWPMKGRNNQPVLDANEAIVKSKNDQIRLFTVKRNTSLTPLDDFKGEWKECMPENVADFSATAYYYGKMLQEILGVPVGLICTSWGGTRIEPWISEDGIKSFDSKILYNKSSNEKINYQTPTVLFNAMINPMGGFGIKGFIWYQGESNINVPEKYKELFPILINEWRNRWGLGDLPFYFAQIAPYDYGEEYLNSAYLREVQLNVSKELLNTGMACLIDIGEENCIHPSNKKITGDRLAYLALSKTYNIKGFASSSPTLKEMSVSGNVVSITFNDAENGLTSFGNELVNFKVAGEDKKFYIADARITGNRIIISSIKVLNPVAVRYAFDDYVHGELYNTFGIPVSSFRTDNWEYNKEDLK